MAMSVKAAAAGVVLAVVLAAGGASAQQKPPVITPAPGLIGPYLTVCSSPRLVTRWQLLVADCPGGPKTAMGWRRCESIVWNSETGMLDCQPGFMHPHGSDVPESIRQRELK